MDTCASRGCHAAGSDSHMLMPINKSVYCNHNVKAVLLKDLISSRLALEKTQPMGLKFLQRYDIIRKIVEA